MPSHSWTPTIPNIKKTKKHSSSTLPSMGRVSSKSITSIRIPVESETETRKKEKEKERGKVKGKVATL
ncbi:hypothetical protein K0M31_000116 [Melipona bicolor]|uniref:Uncharacterized protein n=1 Tax=Melipona bicolor TaxID=60889 RepID=A0AA40KWG6_9HYME|nr:hypothetical protein K0M31_000116 [Melipona bicolor]